MLKLFLVGGFLGSGKTTAIYRAVKQLNEAGKKTGVITNDQGEKQVDTDFFRWNNINVEEVSSSCFCCNLRALEQNIQKLRASAPELIFAESVGSCTDLLATVANPLINAYGTELEIVLSIFADVQVLISMLEGKNIFHDNIKYIYEKQLEEAEILVISKVDLLNDVELNKAKQLVQQKFSSKKTLYQNSYHKENISDWLTALDKDSKTAVLRKSLEIDYDKYGAGEAEMAWLDEEIRILAIDNDAVSAGMLFIEKIREKLVRDGYPIGHLKFLLNDGQTQRKISYTSNSNDIRKQSVRQFKTDRVIILVNARVQTTPAILRDVVSSAVEELEKSTGCKVIESKLSSFQPGYPRPTERIAN